MQALNWSRSKALEQPKSRLIHLKERRRSRSQMQRIYRAFIRAWFAFKSLMNMGSFGTIRTTYYTMAIDRRTLIAVGTAISQPLNITN